MIIIIFILDFDESNAELSTLIESVRGEAAKLLELLDVSTPTVKKLKVCILLQFKMHFIITVFIKSTLFLHLFHNCMICFQRMLGSVPGHQLADVCASLVKASYAEKLQVLETLNLTERFKKILPLIMRQVEGIVII